MDPSHPHTAEPDPSAVDALFDALLDLSDEERDHALSAADVDESVRTRVRRLLAAADDPPPELDAPAVNAEFIEANTLPASIGPYAVRGLVGVGAMGVVYRAEQARPKRIALKIMRAAFDDDERAWRFTREAELLGRLSHTGRTRRAPVTDRRHGRRPVAHRAARLQRPPTSRRALRLELQRVGRRHAGRGAGSQPRGLRALSTSQATDAR